MASKKRRRPATTKAVAVAVEPAAPEPKSAPRRAAPPVVTDPRDTPWTPKGLLALLGLTFIVQIPVGVIVHAISGSSILIIDIFFFQPQYLVVAAVLVMPLARRLTRQPRNLRLLESLSLGIMYSLLALMLSTVFVHPANAASSTQFIRNLKVTDGLLIALSDVIALFGTVTLYPGFSRLLGAPGRRARARLLQRTAGGSSAPRTAASRGPAPRSSSKPKR